MSECPLPVCPAQHVMDGIASELRGMRASLEHQADRLDDKLDLLRADHLQTRATLERHLTDSGPLLRNYQRVTTAVELASTVATNPWILRTLIGLALALIGAGSIAELAHALGWRP